ncbi:MAG: TlpA family protein disulfide reductase [Chitinophagales bacterium]
MNILKSLSFMLILLALVGTSNVYAQDEDEGLERLPDLELKNLGNKTINVSSYGDNGKITVFSFWATWCIPCKKELNNIADVYEDWQDDYDVEVIAVATDDSRTVAKVKPYVNGKAWDYDVLYDTNQKFQRAIGFQTVPYTVVVDEDGDIMYEHSGYVEGDENELEEIIKELLED